MNKFVRDPNVVFVFGSNVAGRHGAGAALHAFKYFDAEYGVGVGPTGRAYAIPTKDSKLKILGLREIERHVLDFVRYAHERPYLTFLVTAIGCGLAGYQPEQIAPAFRALPENCFMSARFNLWSELVQGVGLTPTSSEGPKSES